MLNAALSAFLLLLLLTTGTADRVRLVDGSSRQEGRLEVYHNGTWGTVCDDYFNDAAAKVVCYMLGYEHGLAIIRKNRYVVGSGPIWLDDVRCNGTETSIANCRHRGWGRHNCWHGKDVSVSCTTVRLVGGSSPQEGRLEVHHNGTWGTVCDDQFTDATAKVVCYMLGHEHGLAIDNRYGVGSGQIWLTNVQCNGTETNIANCQHNDWGRHNCTHDEDVSVKCFTRVRLVGGSSPHEGRLEVYHNGAWGRVCGRYSFNNAAASVVCFSLGFGSIGQVIDNLYGAGSGPIWLQDVQCTGTETSIGDCGHSGWGSRYCHHIGYAVRCMSEVRVRLVGSSSPKEGRLEVHCNNSAWGTVCDDNFNNAAARVACYMLGYGHIGYVIGNRYGAGRGRIWLTNVQCNGTETSIADCRHSGWGRIYGCRHYRDVSVSCTTVRLVGGRDPREGRLEVYHNGTWGTVCHNYFTHAAARVVCYMLGYEDVGRYIGNRYGAGSGTIWLDSVQCSETETNITDCRHRDWGNHSCEHDEDVSVSCFSGVRLVGNSSSRGRLEVYHNGTWGTVCGNGFTDAAARVVCHSLGLGRHGRFIGNSYGAGSGRIWLDNVRCGGLEESHITECIHNGWGRHNCSHSDDVSVSCVADSTEAVALVGGGNPRFGRLELFHANQWGTVCGDGFIDAAARVVCYSLGFGYVGRKVDIELYGVGDGLIWFDNVNCTGTEQHIGECSHGDWRVHSCTHDKDVAVSCTDDTSAANKSDSTASVTPVRLTGGSSSRGRLEVLHEGVWGTVCEDYFTATEARVVCKMLGLGSGSKIDNINYRTEEGPIWLDDLRCNGTETDIADCSHNGWGVHNCQHREDVAISCAHVEIRLNGGRDPREGRIELFYNGTWGTVCIPAWHTHPLYMRYYMDAALRTAGVVCNMLGHGHIGRPAAYRYYFTVTPPTPIYGAGTVPIWLNSVQCTGTEESIIECSSHNGRGDRYCPRDIYGMAQTISCLRDGSVALVGGSSPREGRLEVFHVSEWGTVCDDGFTDAAARVVCHSLGFGYIGREMNIDIYGVGTGLILLDDIECNGNERHIGECSHRGWGVHDCTHREDVAVSCVGDSPATSATPTTSPSSTATSIISTSSATLTDSSRSSISRSFASLTAFSRSRPSTSTSSATLTDSSSLSTQSGSNHEAPDTTYQGLILDGATVLLIIVVLVVVVWQFFRIEIHSRRNPRQEHAREASVIPMHVTSSSGRDDDDVLDDVVCGNPANDTEASNNYVDSNFQQSFAPAAGAVGDVRTGDISSEPFVKDEALSET